MTTNRRTCNVCETRRPMPNNDICEPCFEEGGWENTHNDQGHDDIDTYSLENTIFTTQAEVDKYIADTKIEMQSCWICHPELNKAQKPKRTGHTNTVAKSRTSHAGCYHERTPQARAMCRKAGGAGSAGSLKLFPAPKITKHTDNVFSIDTDED